MPDGFNVKVLGGGRQDLLFVFCFKRTAWVARGQSVTLHTSRLRAPRTVRVWMGGDQLTLLSPINVFLSPSAFLSLKSIKTHPQVRIKKRHCPSSIPHRARAQAAPPAAQEQLIDVPLSHRCFSLSRFSLPITKNKTFKMYIFLKSIENDRRKKRVYSNRHEAGLGNHRIHSLFFKKTPTIGIKLLMVLKICKASSEGHTLISEMRSTTRPPRYALCGKKTIKPRTWFTGGTDRLSPQAEVGLPVLS